MNEHYMNKNKEENKEDTGQMRYAKKIAKLIVNGPRNIFELR